MRGTERTQYARRLNKTDWNRNRALSIAARGISWALGCHRRAPPELAFLASLLLIGCTATLFAQNEIAWQIGDAPGRPLDRNEPVMATDGYGLVGVRNDTIGVYDLESGALIRDIVLPAPGAVERRAFTAGNGRLVVGDHIAVPNPMRQSRVYAFDIASGRQVSQFQLPTPTLRFEMAGSLATDGKFGVVSSISCLDTCFDEMPEWRGVVDVFDVASGDHLRQVTGPEDAIFGQGVDVDGQVIAVSARGVNPQSPGEVLIVEASTGQVTRSITSSTDDSLQQRFFGTDLALESNRLVVGGYPHDVPGGDGGTVEIYDIETGRRESVFSHTEVGLEGSSAFGHAVDAFGGLVIAGAPGSGKGESQTATEPIGCELEAAPCSPNGVKSEGAALLIDIESGGVLSRAAWTGGDSVAITQRHALVQSVDVDRTSVYAISLDGFLESTDRLTAANLQTRGDFDGSGEIDLQDFLLLSANYGQRVSGVAFGDLNANGVVEFSDYLTFSTHFGTRLDARAEVARVPEPQAFSIAVVVILGWGFGSRLARRTR